MRYLNNQKGFSLIELLIAVTIFSVGLLAVATMQTTSVKGNSTSQLVSESTFLGQDQIEKLLTLPYDHADLSAGSHTLINGNFTYNWTVTDNDRLTNTKTIRLDVDYTTRGIAKQARIIAAKADLI